MATKGIGSAGFASGFAQGFSKTFGLSLQHIAEKRKQDKIDNKAKEFKLQAMEYAKREDDQWADGVFTQEEHLSNVRWSIPFGAAMTEWVTEISGNARKMTMEELDATMEEMDAFIAMSEKLDFTNYDEMLDYRKNFKKFPKALIRYDAALKSIKAKLDEDEPEKMLTASQEKLKETQRLHDTGQIDDRTYIQSITGIDPERISDDKLTGFAKTAKDMGQS